MEGTCQTDAMDSFRSFPDDSTASLDSALHSGKDGVRKEVGTAMIAIEEMSLHAWPALQTSIHKGCIFRVSDGYSRRANSANPLYMRQEDALAVIDHAETLYAQHNLPPIFKILDGPSYAPLDALLVQRRYEKVTPTLVMTLDRISAIEPNPICVDYQARFTEAWFNVFADINMISGTRKDTAWQICSSIENPVVVASVRRHGEIVACGYGAIENGYVGLFDIVVRESMRRKGLGKALVEGLLLQANRFGAERAYLQVVDSNVGAKRLYSSIGFTPSYTYWYRQKFL